MVAEATAVEMMVAPLAVALEESSSCDGGDEEAAEAHRTARAAEGATAAL